MTAAVSAEGIVKRFGETVALDSVSLEVGEGTVQGLLGPNGAGKTTLVRTLATLLKPDEGSAEVFGHDVRREAETVRRMIGLTGQFAAVDEILTGRENLEMFGLLFRLPRKQAAARADELLGRFDLADAADRPAKTYSGGMRRRLDLASSMLVSPRLLFLDEPTTGLDPRSRTQIWEVVRELVRDGTTVLLTTQYLDEADQLADRIAVIDHGRLIAEGTGDELKERVGGQVIDVRLANAGDREAACRALAELGCGEAEPSDAPNQLTVPAPANGGAVLGQAAAALYDSSIQISDLGLRRPTLDDVFLQFTGSHAEPAAEEAAEAGEPVAEPQAEREPA